jgi:hypothetical protein
VCYLTRTFGQAFHLFWNVSRLNVDLIT